MVSLGMNQATLELAPSRPGTYACSTETVDAILKSALAILIEEGAGAFTIRRIAARAGMRVGNVSYHFPRKEMLIQIMLDEMMSSYSNKLDIMVRQPDLSDEERLRVVIIMCLEDIAGQRTTHLFTELWALANQNESVAERLQEFYGKVHAVIGEYVSAINPHLSPDEVHGLSLFISASMEGATPFLGFAKPWAADMPTFIALAVRSMVDLVKSIKPGEIAALTSAAAL